ncbi:cytosolic sulfotransferase 3-like [Megalops cyprinoides]|uniref:cytosolic sulfotransferase 3-like n=1 Tax=Megalops cyprinoides TaxID=118141 RepID=UPI0018645BB2|nr:cytosolic sulfotransferase 3-like [Megalops cyprinoides]XP_036402427.1 cytosolic sulfotransferase 3-like [Megalops cyprinoides]
MSGRPEVFEFEGISLTHFFTDNWENVKNFKARPDDILIATYPKAGTTWLSEIVDQLYFGGIEGRTIPLYERVPFLELCGAGFRPGTEAADNLPSSPRLIKTHLPVQLVPKSFWEQNCRVLYVARNPKDTIVSFYHFDRMNQIQPEAGPWDDYIHKFNSGKLVFGSWYDHVQGWWDRGESYPRMLYLFYEDMKVDLMGEISRICSFLGLSPSEKELQRVTGLTKFEVMKENSMADYSSIGVLDQSISPFMRKGTVGDWKNHFTVAQNQAFDEEYKKRMGKSTLTFRMEI